MRIARFALRVGGILALLLAAIVLAVGTREYPGTTRPAFRFAATEVLPLLAVGVLNLVAASDWRAPSRIPTAIALLASVLWLTSTLPRLVAGGAPAVYAEGLLSIVLVIAGVVRLTR